MNNNNIYLELELSLDPAITDSAALKIHLEQKINEWNKLVNASPKFKQKVAKAREFIQNGLTDLTQQANDAKQIRLATLRENIKDLSYSGEIQQFEIDYLKRNFPCFNEVTIQNEINNFSRSIISSAGEIINTGKSIFSAVKNINFPIQNIFGNIAKNGLGKWILLVPLLLIFLYMASYIPGIVGGLFRNLPGIPFAQSYERGVGSYVNRYAKRSYDNAKWEAVELPANDYLRQITGWDKDNLLISIDSRSCLLLFNNGNWKVDDCKGYLIRYLGKNLYVIFTDNSVLRFYDQNSYKSLYNVQILRDDRIWIQQFNNKEFFIVAFDRYNRPQLIQYSNEKLIEIKDKDKMMIWDNGKKTNSYIHQIICMHTFQQDRAVGFAGEIGKLVKYRDKKWQIHYPVTHRGCVNSLWAIDEDNLVMVGNGITVFRKGSETHPLVNTSDNSFNQNDCMAVWGADLNCFWVVDRNGNVAEFKDGQAGKVVVKDNLNQYISSCWVSPEGTVYVITRQGFYRLD
jgi:uncharacterized protein YkvS